MRTALVVFIGFLVAGYASTSPAAEPQHAIPPGVICTLIKSSEVPGVKRSLDLRLNKKVSVETLRAISMRFKAQDPRSYRRIFMTYYLPGMEVGAGAWATAEFTPKLNVTILGATAEEEETLTKKSSRSHGVVGRWLDERPLGGSRIEIFREKGKLRVEQIYKDGSGSKHRIVETKTSRGRRFDYSERRAGGEYWLLLPDGDLQLYDEVGLISTAKKLK